MMPARRKDALEAGVEFYKTSKPCKRGHFDKRRASNGRCETCRLEDDRAKSDYRKQYAAKNRQRLKEYKSQYRKEKGKELYLKERATRDLEKTAEYQKEYGRSYRENNRPKINLWAANRRGAERNRTPQWLTDNDKALMLGFYEQARQLTKDTGIEHHVDHIVPLQGSLVSGLHVPWNLQVMTARENLSKNNRFEVAA